MKRKNLLPSNGAIFYTTEFFSKTDSDQILDQLLRQTQWRQESVRVFGKTVKQPRLIAWQGDKGLQYTYSNLHMSATQWTPLLQCLREKVEKHVGATFNGVLLNYYRNGADSMGWHSDNENELGINPIIASLSFGAARDFFLKNKSNNEKVKIELQTGSLLVMQGETQTYWQHSLPKRLKVKEPRINLTFRAIKKPL